MKTRLIIFAAIFLALLVLNATLYFSLRSYLSDLLLVLEKEQATLSIQRLLNAFERETLVLDELNYDWAAWDDTYEFVLDQNPDYVESNLVDSTFVSSRLDLIVILDTNGKPVYQQVFDREEEEALAVPGSFYSALKENPKIWQFGAPDQFARGFLELPEGILQLSARPIINSNDEGPVRGTMFMGRFFSAQEHARLTELTEQQFTLGPDPNIREHGILVKLEEPGQLRATSNLFDLLNRPLWHLSATFPRSFFQTGLQSLTVFMRWNLLLTGALALLLAIIGDKLFAARTRLVNSRQRYRDLSLELQTILDGIASPILLISKELMILWTNKAGARIYGQSGGEVSGKLSVNLPFESFDDDPNCPVRRAFLSGQAEEEVVTRPDGKTLVMSAFPLAENQGPASGVICLLNDITEQARLHEEAEQRNRLTSLGEMAAELAHDINNPVGMLMLNLPMIQDVCRDMKTVVAEQSDRDPSSTFGGLSLTFLTEKMPYLLQEMISNTGKIKKLSEDMTAFSRRQVAGPAEVFSLNAAARSAVRLVNYRLNKRTKHLEIHFADGLPKVHGRLHQIEQVVVNLLLNSSQALQSTEESITVRTGLDQASSQVYIEITDTGRGIAEGNLPEITKPFFTTRQDSGGTGLGLSLAARIVRGHGGTMKFTSTPDVGTTVRVCLPSAQDDK